MERKQFTFYRSYYEAIKSLPSKDREKIVMAICAYALDEEMPTLSGAPLSVFTVIRPTLDAGRRKAENGKQGGKKQRANSDLLDSLSEANGKQTESKTEANGKQTGSKKENENEIEIELELELETENENECYTRKDADVSAVVSAWMNKINPVEPPMNLQELIGYVKSMGKDVCLRAIDITLSNLKGNSCWAYTRSILQRWMRQGVKCLADVERVESKRVKSTKSGEKGGVPDYDYEGDDTL